MSKTLLLADDSVVIQKLVGLSFANEDVEIVTTDNGDDAVIRARELKPDVVLADVVMPGKSGYEVCEAIKQDPTLAHIPVLLLTGTFEAFDEGRAAAAGADGQITKPFEAQSLVERVSEVMNAPAAAPTPAAEPAAQTGQPVSIEASSADFDFFDANVSTLSADASASQAAAPPATTDQTPAISSFDIPNGPAAPAGFDVSGDIAASNDLDVSEDSLFGAPGDGATDELDTQGGGMALGESMTPGGSFGQGLASKTAGGTAPGTTPGTTPGNPGIDHDATVVALPEPVTPLPPSQGDPLAAFEQDFGLNEMPAIPAEPITPPAPADLDSAFDSVPSDPVATIVAGVDDNNASTSPSYGPNDLASDEPGETAGGYSGYGAGSQDASQSGEPASSPFPADDEFEDLTIHAPSAAIDQAVASAPSPTAIDAAPHTNQADPNATVVANLDVSLADSSPSMAPDAPNPLDLGPSNVSADELDFAFDVSEQAPAGELDHGPGESFSSLMDISESQILVGPNSDSEELEPEAPPIDDAFAAGYDVSVSDLVTAAPPEAPEAREVSAPASRPLPAATEIPAPAPPIAPDVSSRPLAAGEPVAIGQMSGFAANDDLEIATPAATTSDSDRISDLSPMIEQQIQETLEKVAWEAFSDLSETIVKQVIGRVEKIAWEVIPQMAETLVREEIRKMKGEND